MCVIISWTLVFLTSQPTSKFPHFSRHCSASFSRAKLRVNSIVRLHVGQLFRRGLHFEQILWPFLHRRIGGSIHSKHTGHSRTSGRHWFNPSSTLLLISFVFTDKTFPFSFAILEHSLHKLSCSVRRFGLNPLENVRDSQWLVIHFKSYIFLVYLTTFYRYMDYIVPNGCICVTSKFRVICKEPVQVFIRRVWDKPQFY